MGSRRGGVFVKILLAVVGLVLVGATGGAAWWFFTEEDRELEKLDRYDGDWDWMAAHGDRPKVQEAVLKKLDFYATHREDLGKGGSIPYLDRLDKVFRKNAPTSDAFAAAAARVWLRKDYAPAAQWVKGFESDPRVTAALRHELVDVATYEYGWKQFYQKEMNSVDAMLGRLLPELERRGVSVADPEMRNAAVSCELRYELKSVRPWVAKVEGTTGMKEAVAAHAARFGKKRGYSQGPGEVARVCGLLTSLKIEPTDDILISLGHYGADPETNKPFAAWPPETADRLSKLRDEMGYDKDWERTQTTFLIGRLGRGTVSATDIQAVIDEVRRRYRESMPDFGFQRNEPLLWRRIYVSEFSKVESSIAPTVKSLSAMCAGGGAAMIQVWQNSTADRLALYVTTRALAAGAPAALAKALDAMLDEFDPIARRVAAKGTAQEKNDPIDILQWRRLAPPLHEAMAALSEAQEVPDETAAGLWHALSCPDRGISEPAGATLEKKLPADRFARGLFLHLNQKEKYQMSEVDGWIERLTRRPESGPHVAAVLQTLLDVLKKPEDVPLIQKVVGLRALAVIGTAAAKPVLEKYAADTSTYTFTSTKTRGSEVVSSEKKTLKFADLARTALESIK